MNSTAPPKFPPIEGLSIDDARPILRTANRGGGIGIEEVIQIMDCDAHRADKVLRAMAMAGYLNPSIEPDKSSGGSGHYWATGSRLRKSESGLVAPRWT